MTQNQIENIQSSMEDKQVLNYKLECSPPIKDIYKFEGALSDSQSDEQVPLDLRNFIPRGATIRNSKNVIALVVYTGGDTKQVLNQGQYRFKISSL